MIRKNIEMIVPIILLACSCLCAQSAQYDKNLDKLVASLVSGVKDKSVKKIVVANFCETSSKQRFILSDILEEDLTTKLIQTKKYDVIVKSRTDEILKELQFGNEGFVDPLKVKQFGKFAQADAILMGTYREKDKDILVNAQLINVETMEAVWGGNISIPKKEFPQGAFQFPNIYQEQPKVQLGEKEKPERLKRTGSISIISDPSDAEINLDAVTVGRTPAIIQSVSVGQRKLTLFKDGYEDYITDIKIEPNKMYSVKAMLKQQTGVLKIETDPSGADIYVDGYKKGSSPLELSLVVGTYEVKAKKDNYQDYKESVEVAYKEVVEKKFQLTETPGSLLVKVQPSPATVYIDNEEKGKADPKLSFKTFPAGEHKIRVIKNGYEDYEESFVIHSDKSETISAVLKKGVTRVQEAKVTTESNYIPYRESPAESEKKKTFGIGFGNPYLSLLYNPSNRITLELRYAWDLAETHLYIARIYLNFNRIYLAAEYGKFDFTVTNTWDYSYNYTQGLSGDMYGIYLGYSIKLSRCIDLNIDAGPAYLELDKGYETIIEYIINTGLRFWL